MKAEYDVSYIESLEKEASEERKLKTRVLDKYADFLIEEAELLKKLKARDEEIEGLKKRLAAAELGWA